VLLEGRSIGQKALEFLELFNAAMDSDLRSQRLEENSRTKGSKGSELIDIVLKRLGCCKALYVLSVIQRFFILD
jgi:hypothetical protein